MPSEPKTLSITHWAEADRPREKLERLGANALSDAELLAILIGSGTPKESAVDLMKRILNDCKNNLNSLGKLSLHDLEQYKGIGPAKAITILAACELGKRRQKATVEEAPILNSADGIYQFMHTTIQDLDIEEAWVLMMKQNFRLIEAKRISVGGLTMAPVDIRLMMKEVLLKNKTIQAATPLQVVTMTSLHHAYKRPANCFTFTLPTMLCLPMEAISPIEKKGNYSEETTFLDFSSRTK